MTLKVGDVDTVYLGIVKPLLMVLADVEKITPVCSVRSPEPVPGNTTTVLFINVLMAIPLMVTFILPL
jgi:hypothetical protein